MDQPPLDNKTDFAVHPQVLLDKDGEKLVAIVKATFEVHPHEIALAPADRRRGIRLADAPWDPEKPQIPSILYPGDVCLRKPMTDVVVIGRAYAPGGQAVPSFDVYAQVGSLRKVLRVFGLRVWEHAGTGLSPARPIADIDLRYDYAWGGTDASDETSLLVEPRNPVGMGIARDPESLTDRPAPHIEDPAFPIVSCRTRPPPAGLGPIGRTFEPRLKYVGTFDKVWQELRCPLMPDDHDDRANQFAPPGLLADPPLVGGEQVALMNVVRGGGPRAFTLPRTGVEIEFKVKGREPVRARPHLDTVVIDTLLTGGSVPITVELVWRASVKAPRKMHDSKIVVREIG